MKNAFNVTQNVMLPIFDEAINLNNCIEHFYKLGTPMDICCDLEEFNTKPHYYYSEGLLLIKTGYKGDITPYMENILAMKVKEVEKGLSRPFPEQQILMTTKIDFVRRYNSKLSFVTKC